MFSCGQIDITEVKFHLLDDFANQIVRQPALRGPLPLILRRRRRGIPLVLAALVVPRLVVLVLVVLMVRMMVVLLVVVWPTAIGVVAVVLRGGSGGELRRGGVETNGRSGRGTGGGGGLRGLVLRHGDG
uniref:Uncharacterized protein n=1 Tax=Arundo donax TaxID=35708 RepID=A0A0A9F7S5_ARUDO